MKNNILSKEMPITVKLESRMGGAHWPFLERQKCFSREGKVIQNITGGGNQCECFDLELNELTCK